VSTPYLEVIRIVRRRNLDRSGSKRRIDRVISDDRNQASQDREPNRLANEMGVPLVIGVNGHGRIPEHRFRPSRGHYHTLVASLDWIGEMPQVTLDVPVDHFQVG